MYIKLVCANCGAVSFQEGFRGIGAELPQLREDCECGDKLGMLAAAWISDERLAAEYPQAAETFASLRSIRRSLSMLDLGDDNETEAIA